MNKKSSNQENQNKIKVQTMDGYKQTEVGVIPVDWEVYSLAGIIIVLTDFTANGSFASLAQNVQYLDKPSYARLIRLTDIRVRFKNEGIYISKVAYEFLSKSKLFGKELLLANVGAYTGYSFLYPKGLPFRGSLGPNMFLIKFDEKKINSQFAYYSFNHTTILNQLLAKAASSAQPKLNKQNVRECKIPLPPTLAEQTAIATALSDMDSLIEGLEKLIAKKRNIKQGAMQELLKPFVMVNGKPKKKEGWEVKTLGEIAEFFKGKGLPKSSLNEDGDVKCIHYGELFLQYGEIIKEFKNRTNRFKGAFYSKSNDVLMPTSDVTPFGLATASCINENEVLLGGDILIIRFLNKFINGNFFSFYLKVHRNQVMQLVKGVTVYHLYASDMKNFILKYPKIQEQTRIAQILSDMDTEIAKLETQLSKYKMLKTGMMQELLTGKKRLI